MADNLFTGLLKRFEELEGVTQAKLATAIGVSQPAIGSWLKGKTAPNYGELKKVLDYFFKIHASSLITPLVEFKPITPLIQGKGWRLDTDPAVVEKIRNLTEKQKGVYLFYDSAGQVIYVGMSTTNLYGEIKQRLNAEANRPMYNPNKKVKPLVADSVKYLSAYKVREPEAIHNLEAFLLRAFANDIMNKNRGNMKNVFPA